MASFSLNIFPFYNNHHHLSLPPTMDNQQPLTIIAIYFHPFFSKQHFNYELFNRTKLNHLVWLIHIHFILCCTQIIKKYFPRESAYKFLNYIAYFPLCYLFISQKYSVTETKPHKIWVCEWNAHFGANFIYFHSHSVFATFHYHYWPKRNFYDGHFYYSPSINLYQWTHSQSVFLSPRFLLCLVHLLS